MTIYYKIGRIAGLLLLSLASATLTVLVGLAVYVGWVVAHG